MNYGKVVREYREKAGWTGDQLASWYSEALGLSQVVTKAWVCQMETKNRVPDDPKRRWVLATLLNIPPALLGLTVTEPQLQVLQSVSFDWKDVDLQEYRLTLETYCHSWGFGKLQEMVPDIKQRVSHLYEEGLSRQGKEKKEALDLLCGYLSFVGNIFGEAGVHGETIKIFNRVVTIAKDHDLYDVLAYALRQRGVAHMDRGEITAGLLNFAAAQEAFQAARVDLEEALSLKEKISPMRYGLVLCSAGRVYAHLARDEGERIKAVGMIDGAGRMVGKQNDEKGIPAKLDKGRYHLSKASTLIAPGIKRLRYPKSALEELGYGKTTSKMRQVERAIREAEAYFLAGEYVEATVSGTLALPQIVATDARQHLNRLSNLHKALLTSSFAKDPDVTNLGIELLKAQQPQLFN